MKLMFKFITIGFFLICLITQTTKSQNYADSGYYYRNIGIKENASPIIKQNLFSIHENYQVKPDLAYQNQGMKLKSRIRHQYEYAITHILSENKIKMLKDAIAESNHVQNLNIPNTHDYGIISSYADSGYYYLKKGNKKKAAECFELYLKENPADIKIHLQLGYIYYDIKNYSKSKYHFDYVAKNSKDQQEVEKARSAAFVINEEMSLNAKRSLDVYFYNFYDTYQENYIANLVSHVNFKIAKNTFGGLYLDLYTDTKSTSTVIYNDRFIEIGAFLRYNFLKNLFLEFRLGYAHQIDLDTSRINIKPLLVYFTRFGDAKVYVSSGKSSKTSLYMDLYSAAMYDYKYKNAFLQIALQEVLRFHTGGYSYLEGYLVQTAQFDSRRLNYNNYSELGAGVRFHANISTFPVLFVEPTYKAYFYKDPTGTQKNSFQVKAGFFFIFRTKL